jgi:sulfatase modifying factor 1
MSLLDVFNENDGMLNTMGHMAAISQRNQQIAQQKEQASAIRAQTAALEAANRNEADRTKIEKQRLKIERLRLKAEDADREMRRQQAEQVKQLRNLMADSFAALEKLRKIRPSSECDTSLIMDDGMILKFAKLQANLRFLDTQMDVFIDLHDMLALRRLKEELSDCIASHASKGELPTNPLDTIEQRERQALVEAMAKAERVVAEANAKAVRETLEAYAKLKGDWAGQERQYEIASGVKVTFYWCPPGDFLMGSLASEDGYCTDCIQTMVTLSKGFWMGKTQLTQAQWKAIMGNNPSSLKGDNLPVNCVSWDETQVFLKKLNALIPDTDGGQMALPTEAQWEYSCRAGETGPYSGGSLDEVAWSRGNSGKMPHEVATKKPNLWGFHDMHGNVWEWCADWYSERLPGGIDPSGPASGVLRVFRGGSWSNRPSYCRSAFRSSSPPMHKSSSIGFRLSRILVP